MPSSPYRRCRHRRSSSSSERRESRDLGAELGRVRDDGATVSSQDSKRESIRHRVIVVATTRDAAHDAGVVAVLQRGHLPLNVVARGIVLFNDRLGIILLIGRPGPVLLISRLGLILLTIRLGFAQQALGSFFSPAASG